MGNNAAKKIKPVKNHNKSEVNKQYKMAYDMLSTLTNLIADAKTYDKALQNAVDIICESAHWDIGHVYALDVYGKNQMISLPIWYFKNESIHGGFRDSEQQVIELDNSANDDLLDMQAPHWYENIQAEPDSPKKKLCNELGIKGAFSFPIIEDDKTIAVLEFFSKDEMVVDDALLVIMQDVGQHIGVLLKHKHIERYLEQQKIALDEAALVSQTDAQGRITYANPAFVNLSGYSLEELVNKDHAILNSDYHSSRMFADMWDDLKHGRVWRGELRDRAKDGGIFWIDATIVPLMDQNNKPRRYLSIAHDITERHLAEERVHQLAFYDDLTGLPNKALFYHVMEQMVEKCKRREHPLAMLLIKIDNFNRIGDSYGHEKANTLIKEISTRLEVMLDERQYICDIGSEDHEPAPVAHINSDTFGLMLRSYSSDDDLMDLANTIMELFQQHFHVDEHDIILSISVGIAIYPSDGASAEDLWRNTSAALYHAEKEGGQHYEFYQESMNEAAAHKLRLEQDLRSAIDRGELELFYQPKLCMHTGKIISHEGLIRWNHHELGMVRPDEFISIAEQSNIILNISEWVLKTAVKQNKRWQENGFPELRVAVNITPKQFKTDLVGFVRDTLEESGMEAKYLELEITEGTIMGGGGETMDKLHALKELGVAIVIDDFGTGYSSLQYLSQFPLDVLKIDQAFTFNLLTDERSQTITKAIISLSKGLGLHVIAEGVETEEQLKFLTDLGCDEAQGYLISKPNPVAKASDFLKAY